MHVLIVGASGVVGRLLCAELPQQTGWTYSLAGRNVTALDALARTFSASASVHACDLSQPGSLSDLIAAGAPDVVVNLAGNYTTTGVQVARDCLASSTMLVDICDEPKPMVQLRALHDAAVAAGVPLVIGAGTAPQTSCALLREVMSRCEPGVALRFGFVLGLNRYGPNAVQTVSRGVSGLMSHDAPTDLWTVGPVIPFPRPFGPLAIRKYPVPETVLLDSWPGVDSWFAGARLIFGWLNAYIRLLQTLGMTEWGVSRFWNGLVSRICRGVYLSHCAAPGIALGIEAERAGRIVRGQWYHPEMSQLTAHAVLLSLEQFARRKPAPGVWWGHEVIEPASFLDQLAARGLVWSVQELASPSSPS